MYFKFTPLVAWQSLILTFKNCTGKWAGLAGRPLASQIYRYKQNKSQRRLGSELEVLSTIKLKKTNSRSLITLTSMTVILSILGLYSGSM